MLILRIHTWRSAVCQPLSNAACLEAMCDGSHTGSLPPRSFEAGGEGDHKRAYTYTAVSAPGEMGVGWAGGRQTDWPGEWGVGGEWVGPWEKSPSKVRPEDRRADPEAGRPVRGPLWSPRQGAPGAWPRLPTGRGSSSSDKLAGGSRLFAPSTIQSLICFIHSFSRHSSGPSSQTLWIKRVLTSPSVQSAGGGRGRHDHETAVKPRCPHEHGVCQVCRGARGAAWWLLPRGAALPQAPS